MKKYWKIALCLGMLGILASCQVPPSSQGTKWYVGTDVPTEEVGNNGDFYLDKETYDIYQKEDSHWTLVGNIKGEDGSDGEDGKDGQTPSISIGEDGYWYINGEKTDVLAGAKKERKWDDDGALKILTIGNSFSDDTMEYLYSIAQSAGVEKVELGNLYIGGCTLDRHYENALTNAGSYEYRVNDHGSWSTTKNYKMLDAVESKDWDFISFQQASGSSGVASTYSHLHELQAIVRKHCIGDSVFVWNMTWAYQQDSSHAEFSKYDKNQRKMYESIAQAVQSEVLSKEEFSLISPTGTAIQNVRSSYLGDHLTRDGYHLSLTYGRYIAGCSFFSALTGISPKKITFTPTGSDAQLKKVMNSLDVQLIHESVAQAIEHPFSITPSNFQTIQMEQKNYVKAPMEWMEYKDRAFYNSTASDQYDVPKYQDSISGNYVTTRKFDSKDLPTGTLITIQEGWQYRPEGWKSGNKNEGSARPGNVTSEKVVVDPLWWGMFTERAFNISKITGGALSDEEIHQAHEAFQIYLPTM